jgi:hypothetical protein
MASRAENLNHHSKFTSALATASRQPRRGMLHRNSYTSILSLHRSAHRVPGRYSLERLGLVAKAGVAQRRIRRTIISIGIRHGCAYFVGKFGGGVSPLTKMPDPYKGVEGCKRRHSGFSGDTPGEMPKCIKSIEPVCLKRHDLNATACFEVSFSAAVSPLIASKQHDKLSHDGYDRELDHDSDQ